MQSLSRLNMESDYSLGDMSDKVDEIIEQVNLPENVFVTFGGDRELLENAKSDMILAVLLAVVLVYIVMAAQFESYKYPVCNNVYCSTYCYWYFHRAVYNSSPISISAVIGILILVGIVVNNGIVLVDYINQRKADGMSSYEAITTSVRDRVRPISNDCINNDS